MKVYVTRRYSFPASHRLHSSRLSDEANRAVYGKCSNPHGHGHNYFLEVTVAGQVNRDTGMVCDLGDLDGLVNKEVIALFDHAYLNMLDRFAGCVPTTENLCIAVYDLLAARLPASLDKVRIEETSNNSFEYCGGRAIKH